MSQDPLAAFIARGLGADVTDVRAEPLSPLDGVERERIRFTREGAAESLVIERFAPEHALEVQLLPFLARRSERVPRVHARGIPPPAVPARSWVLVEDLSGAPSACDGDPVEIVRAKIAVERAVAGDVPALRALGVPSLTAQELVARAAPSMRDDAWLREATAAAERLSRVAPSLAHGDLRCARALVTARGVVIAGWANAHLGCAALDIARLRADLRDRGRGAAADDVATVYVESASADAKDRLGDAEVVDALLRAAPPAYT